MSAKRWTYILITALLFWGALLISWKSSGHGVGALAYPAGGYMLGTGCLLFWWSLARPAS